MVDSTPPVATLRLAGLRDRHIYNRPSPVPEGYKVNASKHRALVTIVFNEWLKDMDEDDFLELTDFTLTSNGSVEGLKRNGTFTWLVYVVSSAISANERVTMQLDANAVQDLAGNNNAEASPGNTLTASPYR